MMMAKLRLIQANIALFAGTYPEARRLLDEVHASRDLTPEDVPQLLWLDAQVQDEPDERLRRLRTLIAQVPSTDPYAQMARQILNAEQEYAANLRAAQSTTLLSNRRAWLWLAVIVLVGGVLIGLTANGSQSNMPVSPTAPASAEPTVPVFADTSSALDPAAHTGRYPQGILQVTRVENASARVIAAQSGELLSPVDGARFYALHITFECRSGVCDQPPEADLALLLDDNTRIPPRGDLNLGGETGLTAVALGRVTAGWIIFEIPLISRAVALQVSARDRQAFDPLSISLQGAA